MKLRIFVLLIITILGGLYFIVSTKNFSPKVTSSPSPTIIQNNSLPSSTDTSDLRAGGSSYRDTQGLYVFLYPADYTLDTQDKQHIRIYKKGATQQGQTEMYDGVIIVFETIQLQGKTLQKWVDASVTQVTADGTSKIIETPKNITLNNYPGITYTLQGLGQATYYVLQRDSQSNYAIVISISVNDPKKVGFQTEVDKILSTLEILK